MEFENEGGVRIELPERSEALSSTSAGGHKAKSGGGTSSSSSSNAGNVVVKAAVASSNPGPGVAVRQPPPSSLPSAARLFDIVVKPPQPPSRLLSIMDNLSDEHSSSSSGGGSGTSSSSSKEPEYESLPRNASTSTHMIAGAVAGVMEHSVMYPIDCVKTRMQSLQPEPAARYRNVMDALKRIVRTEGFWRPMRGLNVTATGAGPAHALYFACYEKIKKTLSDAIHPGGNSHIANGIDDFSSDSLTH